MHTKLVLGCEGKLVSTRPRYHSLFVSSLGHRLCHQPYLSWVAIARVNPTLVIALSRHRFRPQVFFLDHSTKTTTFIDPRLPIVQPPLNPGQVIPLSRGRYRNSDSAGSDSTSDDLVPTGMCLEYVYSLYEIRCPLFISAASTLVYRHTPPLPLDRNICLMSCLFQFPADFLRLLCSSVQWESGAVPTTTWYIPCTAGEIPASEEERIAQDKNQRNHSRRHAGIATVS